MANLVKPDRLFVPMAIVPFEDFRDGGKVVEIRSYGRNFTEKTVRPDRTVELRLGYSGREALWGRIGQVAVGSMNEIFNTFELHDIEPRFDTVQEAIDDNISLIGDVDRVIAFQALDLELKTRT